MSKVVIIFLVIFIFNSCNQKGKEEKKMELKEYDENGKLIVYNEEVYAKMWTKNRNLNVTVIDTFCINQKSRAIIDIKSGKLTYFGFHPREFEKMTEKLKKFGIQTKEYLRRDVGMPGFKPYCYQDEMHNEIKRKYGENFIDSIFKVSQKEYILENPNVKYMENGLDIREIYLNNKNSH